VRRAWSIVVAGVLLVPGLAPVEQAQAAGGAEPGVMMAPDSGMPHAATSAPASVLPSEMSTKALGRILPGSRNTAQIGRMY